MIGLSSSAATIPPSEAHCKHRTTFRWGETLFSTSRYLGAKGAIRSELHRCNALSISVGRKKRLCFYAGNTARVFRLWVLEKNVIICSLSYYIVTVRRKQVHYKAHRKHKTCVCRAIYTKRRYKNDHGQ